MLTFKVTRDAQRVVLAVEVAPQNYDYTNPAYENRNNWRSLAEAQVVARVLDPTGRLYIGTDAGAYVSPRYDIVRVPQVGDKVSFSFNGDTYPCGQVVSVSKTLKKVVAREVVSAADVNDTRVRTVEHEFYRLRDTGCWRKDQTWHLVGGHRRERNPSF